MKKIDVRVIKRIRYDSKDTEIITVKGIPFEIPDCPYHFAVTENIDMPGYFVATNLDTRRRMGMSFRRRRDVIENVIDIWKDNKQMVIESVERNAIPK